MEDCSTLFYVVFIFFRKSNNNIVCITFMFICPAPAVIQLLHVSPKSHKSFQSLATPVLLSVITFYWEAVFLNK